jgi:chemotaxis protein histidine kinase CheA
MHSAHLQQIMGYYIEDAQNHLNLIEQHLLNLQSTIADPERVSELFRAARCGIVGGASLLPISNAQISSIHQTGFCLADCFNIFQQEGSLKVDQKLEDLLMQVFDKLKRLIEQLGEPSGLSDDRATQVMSEIEPTRKALMAHLNWLVQQSHSANKPEVAIAFDSADDMTSLEDLESLIDDLSLDGTSSNSVPNSH